MCPHLVAIFFIPNHAPRSLLGDLFSQSQTDLWNRCDEAIDDSDSDEQQLTTGDSDDPDESRMLSDTSSSDVIRALTADNVDEYLSGVVRILTELRTVFSDDEALSQVRKWRTDVDVLIEKSVSLPKTIVAIVGETASQWLLSD